MEESIEVPSLTGLPLPPDHVSEESCEEEEQREHEAQDDDEGDLAAGDVAALVHLLRAVGVLVGFFGGIWKVQNNYCIPVRDKITP